jgi:hypothetical protein
MAEHRTLTQEELAAEARKRFGDDPLDYAFQCPNCGDIAKIRDFPEDKRDRAGQKCIGRSLGALEGPPNNDSGRSRSKRGCDWAAYGLFPGPWSIVMPDGREVRSVPLADAPVPADTALRIPTDIYGGN